MSIPPLVCSTPPPPDQCEDDKDNGDFDIPYNLSQDEDEDSAEYDYGKYSSYNKYESHLVVTKHEIPVINKTEAEILSDPSKAEGYSPTTNVGFNNNIRDNDETIEDLDLRFDQVSINSGKLSQADEEEISKAESSDSQREEFVESHDTNTCTAFNEVLTQNANSSLNEEVPIEEGVPLDFAEPLDFIVQSDKAVINLNTTEDESIKFEDATDTPHSKDEQTDLFENSSHDMNFVETTAEEIQKDDDDDDFGDFDNFRSAGSKSEDSKVVALVVAENPWGSAEDKDYFGNFKASFDEPAVSEARVEHSTERKSQDTTTDDDDFGDFDDFQSSSAVQNRYFESDPEENGSMLYLQTPEVQQQAVESILSSIFEHDISDTVAVFEGKLETSLCETWGHLMDIDVRQPYMVNWNNSLGQKTLLKALCIDSRNILFGPKWGHMPKYAANLSAAPLQPQKQSTSTSFPTEPANAEKATAKTPGDTWVDPFVSNGKEFTYAEALLLDLEHLMATLDQMAHNHSTLKISDLLHACNVESSNSAAPPPPPPVDFSQFEQATCKMADKVYSSTLNVQPLRQINLPDTHIFTPTDSEIPRSKTIHYDSGSSVLTSQVVANDPEDEYSEFQDFKASTSVPKSAPAMDVTNTNIQSVCSKETFASTIPFQTSMLQPIKLETSIPTLNWPDPGQIKETFEDFSDFVSSTPWQEKQDASPSHTNTSENYTTIINSNSNHTVTAEDAKTVLQDNPVKTYDDDFDTFQSATTPTAIVSAPMDIQGIRLPSHNSTFKSIDSLPTSTLKKTPDFDVPFSAFGALNNDISHTNTTLTQVETSAISQSYIPNNFIPIPESSRPPQIVQKPQTAALPSATLLNAHILQPTRSNAQSKPASGQILQPLSLESYSQINWPNPGDTLDLTDLSRFNPVETLPSLKGDLNTSNSKTASPAHNQKGKLSDDDWGEFVSSEPKQSVPQPSQTAFVDNDEWTDFFSCTSTQPHNGLNTISLNVHTNLNIQKTANQTKHNKATSQIPLEIPKLNYVTPKTNHHRTYSDRHFQNL